MDVEWIKFAFQVGAPLLAGALAAIGAYYALKGKLELLTQRVTQLENMENATLELRMTAAEERIREMLNVDLVSDWRVFRDRTESRLTALEGKKR